MLPNIPILIITLDGDCRIATYFDAMNKDIVAMTD